MSGGWSRYTRGASSGQGTGCGFSIVAGIIATVVFLGVLALVGSFFAPQGGPTL